MVSSFGNREIYIQTCRTPGLLGYAISIKPKWIAPHIIDKGIPTAGLLAQVLVAKYADHVSLYRQSSIYPRS
jgi:hypothetical protein